MRRHAGLSQTDLGKAFGLTRSAVSQWESEGTEPTSSNLRAIAMRWGVDYDWLATGRGTMIKIAEDPDLAELIVLLRDADPDIKDAVALLLRSRKSAGSLTHEPESRDRRPSNRK